MFKKVLRRNEIKAAQIKAFFYDFFFENYFSSISTYYSTDSSSPGNDIVKEATFKAIQGFRLYSQQTDHVQQWFSTGVPQHTRMPQKECIGCHLLSILWSFRPIIVARDAAKSLNNCSRVARGKKRLGNPDVQSVSALLDLRLEHIFYYH